MDSRGERYSPWRLFHVHGCLMRALFNVHLQDARETGSHPAPTVVR
jgi:hypothetical protein